MSHAQNQKLVSSQANNLDSSANDPRDSNLRWIFLFFCCMLTFGSYFGLEVPNNLQIYIEEFFEIKTTEFNTFASLFYIPCMFMPLIGGILAGEIGINKGLIIFGACIMCGHLLMTLGISEKSFKLMMVGRFLHGAGHDSLLVLKKVLVTQWFIHKELSLSIGLGLCVSRLGSSLSGYISPRMYLENNSLAGPFYLATFLAFFSFLCVLAVIYIDNYAKGIIKKNENNSEEPKKFKLADLKKMNMIHFALIFSFCFLYPPFFAFITNNPAALKIRFGFTATDASLCNSAIYAIATILTPLFGWISDKYSNYFILLIISGFLEFAAHLFFTLTPNTDSMSYAVFIPLAFMGLFYAMFSSTFWPSLTLISDENIRSSVFGIAYAGLNTVVTLILIANGRIKDGTSEISGGYLWTEILLAIISGIGCIILIKLKLSGASEMLKDHKKDDGLLLKKNHDRGDYEMTKITKS